MLESVKLALRIKSNAFDSEITGLIDACKIDLGLAGVVAIDDTDSLIKTAITFYCKANFGFNEDSEKWQKAYDNVKCALSLAGDYNAES